MKRNQPSAARRANRRSPLVTGTKTPTTVEQGRIPQLEEELAAARERLQSVIAEHGRANEGLRKAHEELATAKGLIRQAQLATSEAERANRTKDEFLATLSHELRTPLSGMLMRAQLLRRGGMDEVKVKRAGEAIEAGVKMQVQLIDDILDMSRLITGKLSLDLQPVDLAQVVTAAVDSLSLAVARRSLKLTVELGTGESTAMVHGDATRLQQLAANLLTNAIKFTPAHGAVTVSLAIAGGDVVLCVKDSGMGIDPGCLPNVFNRFTQEDSPTKRANGGRGLGLAIVRHLVELHHGSVRAESAGSGMGATFSVALPRIKAPRAPT